MRQRYLYSVWGHLALWCVILLYNAVSIIIQRYLYDVSCIMYKTYEMTHHTSLHYASHVMSSFGSVCCYLRNFQEETTLRTSARAYTLTPH
jgi:hypothetical protein